jgi:hypothetical protein
MAGVEAASKPTDTNQPAGASYDKCKSPRLSTLGARFFGVNVLPYRLKLPVSARYDARAVTPTKTRIWAAA